MADGGRRHFREMLTGFEEFPALSTPGVGEFRASINRAGEIEWALNFSGLESAATQAHIHFESKSNNGPVIVFLCSNLGNGPAGTQALPGRRHHDLGDDHRRRSWCRRSGARPRSR